MVKKLNFIARLMGIGILVFILFKVDLKEVYGAMVAADLYLFICALSLLLPLYFIKSVRWSRILNSSDIHYSSVNSFLVYLSSNFIAFVTPGRVGELAKAFYVKEDTGIEVMKIFPSVLIDRALDVYILTVVALGGTLELIFPVEQRYLGYLLWGGISATPLLLSISPLRVNLLSKLRRFFLTKPWGSRWKHFIHQFENFSFKKLIFPVFLTILAYLLLFFSCYLIVLSINLQLGFLKLAVFVSVVNILSFIPITIAGFGTRDAGFIYLLSTVGILKEEALAFSFLFFILFYVGGGVAGFIAYSIKPLKFSLLKNKRSINV